MIKARDNQQSPMVKVWPFEMAARAAAPSLPSVSHGGPRAVTMLSSPYAKLGQNPRRYAAGLYVVTINVSPRLEAT